MIDESLKPFKNKEINVVNLMAYMDTVVEFEDANEVKVVVDKNNDAIYFSREPIPSRRKGFDNVPMLKQVCIIPFRREYLLKFNETEETELEKIESIDMMRIIENREKVHMVLTNASSVAVDTEDDLKKAEEKMKGDILMKKYINKLSKDFY